MSEVVTADAVLSAFATTDEARRRLRWWTEEPSRAAVVPAVMAHQSRIVHAVSLQDVEQVCRRTGHALGDVSKSAIKPTRYIRDWTTPFAAAHLFHFITEHDQAIPTWQRFRQLCQEPPFRQMFWDPAREAIETCMQRDGVDSAVAHQAMQWRVGNFYYSFLREQWVHAYLRSRGIGLLQHPLADALYRVDGWAGDVVVSLFIGNDEFRSHRGGRKQSPSEFLSAARPAWRFVDEQLPVTHSFGEVHVPARARLDRLAERILAGQCAEGTGPSETG